MTQQWAACVCIIVCVRVFCTYNIVYWTELNVQMYCTVYIICLEKICANKVKSPLIVTGLLLRECGYRGGPDRMGPRPPPWVPGWTGQDGSPAPTLGTGVDRTGWVPGPHPGYRGGPDRMGPRPPPWVPGWTGQDGSPSPTMGTIIISLNEVFGDIMVLASPPPRPPVDPDKVNTLTQKIFNASLSNLIWG